MNPKVTVVGSLNTDLVFKTRKMPEIGETVTGGQFATFPGGKGANQAVAAARLGAAVAMVGCVGDDALGAHLRDGLATEGIDVSHVRIEPGVPSGVALITVDPAGRNTIVVASGANVRLVIADVEAAREMIASSRVMLVQLEVPLEVVLRAAELAHGSGCQVVLDPAPAPEQPLPVDLYRCVSVVNPNEVEAARLAGVTVRDVQSAADAASRLLAKGCRGVVIKLGDKGAFVAADALREMIPGIAVDAVDTTAAGDAFAAAMAVALAEGKDLPAAARFANAVGALKVTRMGAQPGMPARVEVEAFARSRGLNV